MDTASFSARLKHLGAEIRELYAFDAVPWVVGYSGGKDSTATLGLIWWAIRQLPASQRTKPIHVITTDTLVEQPMVAAWVRASHAHMRQAAAEQAMPIVPHLLIPELSETFWVNLIGRGYAAPRHSFRWCTQRMKIQPAARFVREMVTRSGEVIMALGTRKAESANRARSMNAREAGRRRDHLSPNPSLPNSLIYSPIEDWSTDEVWMYLMQVPNPWGHANRDLLTMYRGASADNECPLVVDTTTPSCGNSRFGCWTCTVVRRDRSMEAMIQNDSEKEWMTPLLELRNEMAKLHPETGRWDDRDRRDWRRSSGRLRLYETRDGELMSIPGPYTRRWREHWLRRLLQAQVDVRVDGPPEVADLALIRPEELREIRRIWRAEKHEFDDSLPRIYAEVTGEVWPEDPAPRAGPGPEEWAVLEQVCGEDARAMEMTTWLLGTEQRFVARARRTGVYKALEEVLRTRGQQDEAVAVDEAVAFRRLAESPLEERLEAARRAWREEP